MLQILRHTAFYVVLFLLLSSCAAIKGVKEVSCHWVDTISQQNLHLATTYIYLRTVTDKVHRIISLYNYDNDRKLLSCFFEFMPNKYNWVRIGREYKFNLKGDIIKIINHEDGYSICSEQAMYIGDRYSKRKASKKYPKRSLNRGKWQGKNIGEYHYINRKKQNKMLVIDGNSGKMLKKLDVIITY